MLLQYCSACFIQENNGFFYPFFIHIRLLIQDSPESPGFVHWGIYQGYGEPPYIVIYDNVRTMPNVLYKISKSANTFYNI